MERLTLPGNQCEGGSLAESPHRGSVPWRVMCAHVGGSGPGSPRLAARVAVDRDAAEQRRVVDRISADVASLKDTVNHLLDRTGDVVHKGALQAALSMKVGFGPDPPGGRRHGGTHSAHGPVLTANNHRCCRSRPNQADKTAVARQIEAVEQARGKSQAGSSDSRESPVDSTRKSKMDVSRLEVRAAAAGAGRKPRRWAHGTVWPPVCGAPDARNASTVSHAQRQRPD